MRLRAEHPEWIERRFACDDPGAATKARRVVGEVLGGRVATSVVKRAELVISELMTEGTRDSAESAAKMIVRLGLRQDGCRLEVETAGPLPLLSGLDAEQQGRKAQGAAFVAALSERWGFGRTAEGGTRVWAELSYARRTAEAEAGEQEIARRAGAPVLAGQPESGSADVHVVPDERAATWHVYDAGVAVRLSEHATETEAEAVACVCARLRGGQRVVIHDRYHRTREAAIAGGGGWTPARQPSRRRVARQAAGMTMTTRRR
jgi:hypothetical protein